MILRRYFAPGAPWWSRLLFTRAVMEKISRNYYLRDRQQSVEIKICISGVIIIVNIT